MNKIKQIIALLVVIVGVGFVALPAAPAAAVSVYEACNVGDPADETAVCKSSDDAAGDVVKVVVNTLLFVVGILSVIVIIVSGIMYAASGGDSAAVTKAKGALLYAVIGLVVAFLSYAIVNWVIGRL